MATVLVNVRYIEYSILTELILTIDNHKNNEKILAIAFTVDRAVNYLNASCAASENCLTWYRVVVIIRANVILAFSVRSKTVNLRHLRGDETVQLEGPIRPVGKYDVFCGKIVAAGHIESAAGVRQNALLESNT